MSHNIKFQHGIISTIILITITLGLIAGSTYLYIESEKHDAQKNSIISKAQQARNNAPQLTEEELKEHLANAQVRVGIETRKLEALTIRYALEKDDYDTSRTFLLKEFTKIQSTLLATTDSFFKNPASTQPQLNLLGVAPSDKAFIQSQRALINQVLTEIITKLKNLDPEKTTPEMMDAIILLVEKDIKIIQDYTENLTEIVQNLNPTTGLTQNQIDTYEHAVDTLSTAVEETTEVVVPPTVTVTTEPTTEQQTASQTPVQTVPPVTPEQIAVQTQVVEQAQTEVTVIELQIQQHESSSSNETSSGGGDTSSSSGGDTTTISNPATPIQGNGSSSGSASSSPSSGTYGSGSYYSALPDDDNALPPDAPKLIEGTNGF